MHTPNLYHKLNALVSSGSLKDWRIVDVDNEGVEEQKSKFRNTQKMYLTFPNGEELEVGTFCSGCAEDTCFV